MNLRKKDNITAGSSIILVSYLSVAIMGACVKLVPSYIGMGAVLFFPYTVALMLCLPSICYLGMKSLKTKNIAGHVIRDVAGILTFGLFFLSLTSISLTNAIVLRSTTPFWIPLILFVWKRGCIAAPLWMSITLGFIGVILIVKPGTSGYFNLGTIYALGSGFFMAISALAMRRLSATEPAQRTMFYYCLIAALTSFPFVHLQTAEFTLKVWCLLISIGVLMYSIQYTLTAAFRFAKASVLAPMSYAAIVFSAILDWLFWGRIPDYYDLAGVFLVVFSGLLILLLEGKKEKLHSQNLIEEKSHE